MISKEDVPVDIRDTEPSVETTENSTGASENSVESSEDSSLSFSDSNDEEAAHDVSVSVVYAPADTASASEILAEPAEAYEPEYLNFNLYFGVVFGFYIVLRLVKFVRKALFVRFDGASKEV